MPSTVDLVSLPYVFTQSALLTAADFVRRARDRDVVITEHEMEVLHRERVLVPLLRVSRDIRPLRRAIARSPEVAELASRLPWEAAHWRPTQVEDVVTAYARRRLFDPASERYIAPVRRSRTYERVSYTVSGYLYGELQLISLYLVRSLLPFIRPRVEMGHAAGTVDLGGRSLEGWKSNGATLREVAIAATALEPAYRADVYGHFRWRGDSGLEEFEHWRRTRPIKATVRWLERRPVWLADSAADLLRTADRVDPLARWSDLVSRVRSEKWEDLRGDARVAVDLRVCAEYLLRYYEDLARARQAPALTRSSSRKGAVFSRRLRPTRSVDQILTDFGLSPHPRLVLVVEGDTELCLAPRVLPLLLSNVDEDVISIQNAAGIGGDIGLLMSYFAPRIVADTRLREPFVGLARPLTRALVVLDAEGAVSTQAGREARRVVWVERILRTFAKDDRAGLRTQIDPLVTVTTWNRRGDSFEFAHFTDRQIARAIVPCLDIADSGALKRCPRLSPADEPPMGTSSRCFLEVGPRWVSRTTSGRLWRERSAPPLPRQPNHAFRSFG